MNRTSLWLVHRLSKLDPFRMMVAQLLDLASREDWGKSFSSMTLAQLAQLWKEEEPPKSKSAPRKAPKAQVPALSKTIANAEPTKAISPSSGLPERVLDLLLEEPWCTMERIQDALGAELPELEQTLKQLVSNGQIKILGRDDSVRYGLG
jgi:hypothetical protein